MKRMEFIRILENDNFIVDYDKWNHQYRVSYFEDYHFKEECYFDAYKGDVNMDKYGFAKEHNPKSREIYDFISELDFKNGDCFCFKHGGDGDNGEMLMDLLDCYFESSSNAEWKYWDGW